MFELTGKQRAIGDGVGWPLRDEGGALPQAPHAMEAGAQHPRHVYKSDRVAAPARAAGLPHSGVWGGSAFGAIRERLWRGADGLSLQAIAVDRGILVRDRRKATPA